MTRRLTLALLAMILLAAACGDDSSLDDIVADLESGDEPAQADDQADDPPADDPPADDPPADDPPADDPPADPPREYTADEQELIGWLSGDTEVIDDEADCLLDGIVAEGISARGVLDNTIAAEEDLLVSDLLLQCFEAPENLTGFVENFAAGFSLTAGFDLSVAEASCMVAALGDSGASFLDLESSAPPEYIQTLVESCLGPVTGFESGFGYGDNPVLDALWDGCENGDLDACDELYLTSEIGSDYELFGATCGLREPDGTGGRCGSPFEYGDNADLDALWDACEAGDGVACDNLYFDSPVDSVYEEFGDTCGYRYAESPGFCESVLN